MQKILDQIISVQVLFKHLQFQREIQEFYLL